MNTFLIESAKDHLGKLSQKKDSNLQVTYSGSQSEENLKRHVVPIKIWDGHNRLVFDDMYVRR